MKIFLIIIATYFVTLIIIKLINKLSIKLFDINLVEEIYNDMLFYFYCPFVNIIMLCFIIVTFIAEIGLAISDDIETNIKTNIKEKLYNLLK